MNLVFDADILSTFGKIRRLDLLRVLFPNARFFIPLSVYNELFKARDCGYDFVDYVMESRIIDLSRILKSLLVTKILTSDYLRALIGEIEKKDKLVITDKDDILTESSDTG